MLVELGVLSFEDIFEDDGVDIGEGELIFEHAQEKKSSIEGNMDKKPECILIWEANDDEVANNEVDALSVAHGWKVVGDSLQHPWKINSLKLGKLESSI